MKFGPNFTFIGVNKSPFVFKKSTIMTTTSTLENYMIGIKLLWKEIQKNWIKQIKRMGTDWIRTVDYMLMCPGKVTGLLEPDHSAVTMGQVCTLTLLLLLIWWIVLRDKLGSYFNKEFIKKTHIWQLISHSYLLGNFSQLYHPKLTVLLSAAFSPFLGH